MPCREPGRPACPSRPLWYRKPLRPPYRSPSTRTKQNGPVDQPCLRLRQSWFKNAAFPSSQVDINALGCSSTLTPGSDFDRRRISGAVVEVTGDQMASHIGEDRLLRLPPSPYVLPAPATAAA